MYKAIRLHSSRREFPQRVHPRLSASEELPQRPDTDKGPRPTNRCRLGVSACNGAGVPAACCFQFLPVRHLAVRGDRCTSRQGKTLRAIHAEGREAELGCALLLCVPPLLQVLDQLADLDGRVAGIGGVSVELELLDLEQRLHGLTHVVGREEPAQADAERARVVERVIYL